MPSFQGLGILPGADNSFANRISGNGSVAAVYCFGPSIYHACRWTPETGVESLGTFPGGNSHSYSQGISADGTVLVGSVKIGMYKREAFQWTRDDGMVGLGWLSSGSSADYWYSFAYGVSANGSVIVGYSSSTPVDPQAFRWTQSGGMVGLGGLPGGYFSSEAFDVSDDGSVVVGYGGSPSGTQAFRWTQTDFMVGLGDLNGGNFHSEARAVSGDGSTVVGWGTSASGQEAFRWTAEEGMTGLGSLPGDGFSSKALGVSADGSIVVGTSNYKAFIWDVDNGMRDLLEILLNDCGLDLTGWTLNEAWDVSDDGLRIVGNGHHLGSQEAFLARLPEPATLSLLAAGLALLRRKRASEGKR
jgi:probable HAF family extracellular repeat protein